MTLIDLPFFVTDDCCMYSNSTVHLY